MAKKRISTCIAASTKNLVEQYAEVHGVKKSYLVEQALLHHLRARRELPADILIPPRIMMVKKSYLVEQALLHHLRARRELPADILIPPRIMVRLASFESVIGLVKERAQCESIGSGT